MKLVETGTVQVQTDTLITGDDAEAHVPFRLADLDLCTIPHRQSGTVGRMTGRPHRRDGTDRGTRRTHSFLRVHDIGMSDGRQFPARETTNREKILPAR